MLESIGKSKYMALQSYKKNGEGKITPVWVCLLDGKLYVNTSAESWKVKRIRRNNRIMICSSNGMGTPKSEWVPAQVTIHEEAPLVDKVTKAMIKKYGLQFHLIRWMERLSGAKGSNVVLEITE